MKFIRIAAGATALAIAAYLGATWYMGGRIEQAVQQHLAEAREQARQRWPALDVQVALADYRRGWFSSTMRHDLAFDDPAGGGRLTFAVASEVAHGPLPLAEFAHGGYAPALAAVYSQLLPTPTTRLWFDLAGEAGAAEGRSRIAFDGAVQTWWDFAALSGKAGRVAVDFSGASLHGRTDAGHGTLHLDARMDGLQLAEPLASVDLRGLAMSADSRRGSHGLDLGTSRLSLERLAVTRAGTAPLSLEALALDSRLDEDGASLAGRIDASVEAISLAGRKLGSVQAGMGATRVDARALQQWLDSHARAGAGQAPAGGGAGAAPPPSWQDLLAHAPVLTVEPAQWSMPEGRSTFTLRLEAAPGDGSGDGAGSPLRHLHALQARLSVSQPMAAAILAGSLVSQGQPPQQAEAAARNQVAVMAGIAQSMGLARTEGEDVIAELSYGDGAFVLNGRRTEAGEVLAMLGLPAGDGLLQDGAGSPGTDGGAPLVEGFTPGHIVEVLRAAGHAPTLGEDAYGDPLVTLPIDAQAYGADELRIEFYGCADARCEDIMLQAVLPPGDGIALEAINQWNARSRWVRAYLDEDGQAVAETDINADGGIGEAALELLLDTYFEGLAELAGEMTGR